MKRHFVIIPGWLGAIAAFGAIVMLLWNALIPDIFGLATINFWQAAGLLLFARILLGGFGVGSLLRHGMDHGRNHIHDKWMKMSPEAKEEFMKKKKDFINSRMNHRAFYDGNWDFDPKTQTPKEND